MLNNTIRIVPFPKDLCQPLPEIVGNVDYKVYEKTLKYIDQLLRDSGIEEWAMQYYLQQHVDPNTLKDDHESSPFEEYHQEKLQITAKQALRCIIARRFVDLAYRDFTCRLAESPLLQWFCQIESFVKVIVPSKSTLHRYEMFFEKDAIQKITQLLLQAANQNHNHLGLTEAIDLSNLFVDLTCIKANIHYPVDWVLLRDATITLMKAVKVIRNNGLKNRMEPPELFITNINKLSIKMTHSQYKPGSKKYRKNVLRGMKKLLKKITKHARKHLELLENEWKTTDLSEKQKDQIVKRMNNVIQQLPAAIEQAHERIIGERQVANDKKILSLYEPDVHVIVRGKAGARVEFGNSIFLAEQKDGLIVDWHLYKEQPPADCKTLIPAIERINAAYKVKINSLTGDRGFWDKDNKEYLEKNTIANYICPRAVRVLSEKLKSKKFRKAQTRRAQTEGRIGILKNCFIGNPFKRKRFANQEVSVAHAILTHNLWVLARLMIANEPEELKEAG